MLGVVLSGGQSQRMGSDKGLLTYQGKIWAAIAAEKLARLYIPVKLSVNAQQYLAYADHFTADQLIADDLSLQFKGPLLGLLSMHRAAPEEDLFVLACDMVLMKDQLLKGLFEVFNMNEGIDACIYSKDGQQEPLCGIYSSGALKLLAEAQLPKSSMKYALSRLEVFELPVSVAEAVYFGNFNSPGDLLSE